MLFTLAESFWNKPMPPWAVGLVVIVGGAVPTLAALFNWKSFLQHRKFQGLNRALGEERGRIAVGAIGGLMILGGVLLALGLRLKG